MPNKRVQFDDEMLEAINLLAKDSMSTFQELSEEAFTDLLKKHHRPTDFKSALRQSVGDRANVHHLPKKKKRSK